MTVPTLFTEVAGQTTITCTITLTDGRHVTVDAIADPMTLGSTAVAAMAAGDEEIFRILTPHGRVRWNLAMPTPSDLATLCDTWAHTAGFGDQGFGVFVHIVRHLELVEADLQRFYNLDLSAWPRGEMTTRRLVTLIQGLRHETMSLFWSEQHDMDPISKETIVLAQLASAPGQPHHFLVSREARRQRLADAEAVERMRARGMSS